MRCALGGLTPPPPSSLGTNQEVNSPRGEFGNLGFLGIKKMRGCVKTIGSFHPIINFAATYLFTLLLKTPFVYGIVAGLIAITPRILHYYTDVLDSLAFRKIDLIELGIIFTAIPIGVLVAKLQRKGEMFLFQDAFKSGIKVVGSAAIIVSLFTYVYFKFIDHEIVEQMIAESIAYNESVGATQEVIDASIEGIKQFLSPFIQATSTLMFTLIGGAVVSLLSAVAFGKFAR